MNQHYLNWVHNTCGEQYMFLYHITFSYLLAFISLYTEATHKNNSMRIMRAQVKLAPLILSSTQNTSSVTWEIYVTECKCLIQWNLTLREMKVFQFLILVTMVKVVILSKRKLIKPSNRFYHLGCHHQKSGKEFVEKLQL